MSLKYLLDENVDHIYRTQILQRNPDLVVLVVGGPDVPPKRTPDPEILCWCEENNFVLVTNNRSSISISPVVLLSQGTRHTGDIASTFSRSYCRWSSRTWYPDPKS